jgi:glycosyltransferase involved in cell wall biosynthesis
MVEGPTTKGSPNVNQVIVALVGKRDEPTDALRDYCAWLGKALGRRGVTMKTIEVLWDGKGWLRALVELWKQSAEWRGRWVVLQYTALMWSRRGFPLAVLLILGMLKLRGCQTGIVFHDVFAGAGRRRIDRVRLAIQRGVMRFAYQCADRSIVTIVKTIVPWLPHVAPKAIYIPVGANIPSLDDLALEGDVLKSQLPLTVAAFGISEWPSAKKQEVEAISHAMRIASAELGELRLLVIGRGAREAESALREGLSGTGVVLAVDGLLHSHEISSRLSCCDVLLFVRGPLSSRRGSGLAGIACGLPIVAYKGFDTGVPLWDAGILFVPQDDLAGLSDCLTQVLRDPELRRKLSACNMTVYREWFSWDRIAERLIEVLDSAG